ncbi:MAG: helix-turn-helix domain-containing protein [Planctomycetes bacterium]|nr:helix-turn-helix domain-containing protein [Planctomycetota bacterium]
MVDNQLLLSAKDAAKLLGISERLYYSLHSSGKIPLPRRLNKRTLWSRKELDAWVDAGCPAREQWQEIKKAVGANRN